MSVILEQINSVGYRFVEFAIPMLVQSSLLILILLFVDLLMRKKVKAGFRYWISTNQIILHQCGYYLLMGFDAT